jgi:2,3-bisphosphoglycerate-dependent phosphoglycerate mutase
MKTENINMKAKAIPVILIRHAQSQWNRENRFTGWANPPLTEAGANEAAEAGKWLQANGYQFDAAYSSRLQRAVTTLDILLQQLGQDDLSRTRDWRLNERHYGKLQGINKADATAQAGEHQVWRWRRSYKERATPLLRHEPNHPANDPLYHDIDRHLLPGAENLAQTRARVMDFWHEQITPHIQRGERVLVSAHGNTLRALLMDLASMSVEEVESFEIPTATPILCRFTTQGELLDWDYLDYDRNTVRSA